MEVIETNTQEVENIFHYFYPEGNRGGSGDFFCINVWQTVLHIPGITGWSVPVRILEARLVIRSTIKCHIHEVAGVDVGGWDHVVEYAKTLVKNWHPILESAKEVGKFL